MLTVLSLQLRGQIKIKSYTAATDTFYWKKYEHIPPPGRPSLRKFAVRDAATVIRRFTAAPPAVFRENMGDTSGTINNAGLKKAFSTIDIDRDGRGDIIFQGLDNRGEERLMIFRATADSFSLFFEDYGYLSALTTNENGGFTGLATCERTGIEGSVYLERNFNMVGEEGGIRIVKGRVVASYQYTQRPGRLFKTRTHFTAAEDTILIRASARFIDAPDNSKMKTMGNIICGYTEVIRGELLATREDEAGNRWYYAEIYPGIIPSRSVFSTAGSHPLFIRGWISADDLIVMEEIKPQK